MSRDLNQCNFIGRIGKEIELKAMPNGKAVVNFSIACSDDYKDKLGTKVDRTNWVSVVAFERLAEIIGEYCKKGSRVFVTGKQTTRKWQDNNGNDRYTTEIVANDLQMLDSRPDSAGGQQQQHKPQQPQQQQQHSQQANSYQAAQSGQQRPTQQQETQFGEFDDLEIPF